MSALATPRRARFRAWPVLLSVGLAMTVPAHAQDKKAGALLNKVSYARSVEGDRVEIGFVSKPLMEIAQGPGVLQRIGEAVGHVLGREVRIVPVLWEELREAGGGPPSQPRASHLVDEALKQGAELISD